MHPFVANCLSPRIITLLSSKFKEFADRNFKFDENGRIFSKWVQNTVGKEEIARYEHFFLLPQCFQKIFYCGHVKSRACLEKG